MSDFSTTENDRRIANIAQMGVVEEVNYNSPPKARVRVGELLTGWLRMGAIRAGGDKDWAVYEPGEEVLVVSTSGNLAQGVIVCAINNDANPANANSPDIRRTDFGNGSFIEHNRATGVMTIQATGDVIIKGANVRLNDGGGLSMPGVARTGQDSAGGTITGVLAPTVFVNGTPISVVGDPVAPHGPAAHAGPVMAEGSGTVFAQGRAVCRQGDAASCGHTASGSSNVFAGG